MTNPSDQSRSSTPRSATSVAVDNLIRRALRVSDPTDPTQLAKALIDRFPDDASRWRQELSGSPIQAQPVQLAVTTASGPSREVTEAQSDLDRDLDALLNESQIKDLQPELRGWASSVRNAARAGLASARLALDGTERDRSMAARRTLTDYARLARYLAALTQCVPGLFCRLAQSCDNMGALILVTAGDALAASGVTSTSVILQSASSELQTRREAVLAALRNLTGATHDAYVSGEWPRGLTALRQLHRALEDSGASDLRAFLDEGYLGNVFDEMIALTAGRTPDGLRALGATSVVTTAQLERFLRVSQDVAEPESPQLTTFLTSIQYFIEAFGAARSGHRLIYIARPPILFYGIYGAASPDAITRFMLALVEQRGRFAEALDCFCCCCCDAKAAEALIVGGKALYDIDRTIDLLAQAPSGFGESLVTSDALQLVVQASNAILKGLPDTDTPPVSLTAPLDMIAAAHSKLAANLPPAITDPPPKEGERRAHAMHDVICAQRFTEAKWVEIVRNMSSKCNHRLLGISSQVSAVNRVLGDAIALLETASGLTFDPCGTLDISVPDHADVSLETLVHNIPFKGRNRNSLKKTP